MFKRIISLLLVLCLLNTGTYVVADDTASIVSLSYTDGKVGDIVEIELKIEGCNGFANLGFELEYDRSVLRLLKVRTNPDVGAVCTTAQALDAYPYNIGWDSIENVYFNGTLATFVFEIYNNAPIGKQHIALSHYKGRNGDYIDGVAVNYDENGDPLDMMYQGGYIDVMHLPLEKPEPTQDNAFNGSIYQVFDTQLSWPDAKKLCEDAGGHLATITSVQENDFIYRLCGFGEQEQYFIGATDTTTDGMWSWISGENFVYKNWNDGEPDNVNGGESYLTIYKDNGKWNDESINVTPTRGFICEWEDDSAHKESVYWVEFILKKQLYETGESFDTSRDVQAFLYTDDSVIRLYDYTVEGFDSSYEGECNITVSYGDFSQVFTLEIADAVETEPVVTYIVNATASNGAMISPQGYSEVESGSVMNYVIGTKEGYYIESVTVNGEIINITDSILSLEITQNTTISVSGKKKIFDVEKFDSPNGQILLSANKIEYGDNCTAQIIPDTGYIVADVLVDGVSMGAIKTYTITNIKESHTISAMFEKLVETLTVTAKYGEGGTVVPARSVINKGGSIRFNTVADYGYQISRILVNGEEKEFPTNLIALDNISEDTQIIVQFKKNVYSVSLNQQEGATLSVEYDEISYEGANVPYMDTARIYVDVNNGYKLNALYINNLAVKPVKENERLVYQLKVTGSVIVNARCVRTQTSEYNDAVSLAGKPSDVNLNNAYEKKQVFSELIEQYNKLSDNEKVVCTSAYATVLAALNRADAYIALIESDIILAIDKLPSADILTADNFSEYKENIDKVYVDYEKLNYLSKSFIDYGYVTKLSQLKEKADRLEKESQDLLDYLYGLIEKIPTSDSVTKNNLSEAYSNLMLAENTYFELNDENKNHVSQDGMDLVLFEKHASISDRIYEIYVSPFTSRVLRATSVVSSDSISVAEAKRVTIYGLMDEYHTYADFIREQISASTVQKLNKLYESASITVSTVVNNMPVDMHGDFDENVDLVLSEPEIDDTKIAQTTGKSVYQAIDVKMYSDNIEVQPSSKIRIKMEISSTLSQSDVSIVYIDDDGIVFDVQGEVIEENSKTYIIFFIDHFSNFAVLYNEHEAPQTTLKFDKQTASIGETVTATVSGALNFANVDIWISGYSSQGRVTFIEKASNNSVSGVITEDTAVVKAMLWNKNMSPIVSEESIPVVN